MSIRDIAAAIQNAVAPDQHVSYVLFLRLDFPSGVLRLHTHIGPITWTHPVNGSEQYDGVGDFGGIEGDLTEGLQNRVFPVKFSVSGVDSTLLSTVLTDNTNRQSAELWLGLFDETHSLVDTPTNLWTGFFDKADISKGDGLGAIQCTCVSRADVGREGSDVRYTDEQQQLEQPGDLGFQYLHEMQDVELRWADSKFRATRFTTNRFDRFPIPNIDF